MFRANERHWPHFGLRPRRAYTSFGRSEAQRTAARDRKDFAASDQIRDGLAALGIIIEDTAQGPRWSISQISEK